MAAHHGKQRFLQVSPLLILAVAWLPVSGCALAPAERLADTFGRTYYIDGAGNWGFGVGEISSGLRRAGYRGNIIVWHWSPTLNPALDQTIGRPIARARGKALGGEITHYCLKHPQNNVNIIALSAGTGVAVWACEAVQDPARVHSLIMLGSSLSSNYDMRRALEHISRGVWVYYSQADGVLLGPVRALGTIDGKLGVDGAGLVGLRPGSGKSEKIHNIPWTREFERYGWNGGHTDSTSEPFVRMILGPRHILPEPTPPTAVATRPAEPGPRLTASRF